VTAETKKFDIDLLKSESTLTFRHRNGGGKPGGSRE